VHAVCSDLTRDYWQALDLAALVAAGQGDVPLIQLPLRCSACGRAGHQMKVSGRSYELQSRCSAKEMRQAWRKVC
jgi:hypothetical protein